MSASFKLSLKLFYPSKESFGKKHTIFQDSILAYSKGSVSKTLPRAAGASVSLVLKKGPLPPVPAIKSSTASQQTPEGTEGVQQSSAPPAPVPVNPERLRKSASFKHVRHWHCLRVVSVLLQAFEYVKCAQRMILAFIFL